MLLRYDLLVQYSISMSVCCGSLACWIKLKLSFTLHYNDQSEKCRKTANMSFETNDLKAFFCSIFTEKSRSSKHRCQCWFIRSLFLSRTVASLQPCHHAKPIQWLSTKIQHCRLSRLGRTNDSPSKGPSPYGVWLDLQQIMIFQSYNWFWDRTVLA